MGAVTYIDAEKKFRTFRLNLLAKHGCTRELIHRMRYAKTMLEKLIASRSTTSKFKKTNGWRTWFKILVTWWQYCWNQKRYWHGHLMKHKVLLLSFFNLVHCHRYLKTRDWLWRLKKTIYYMAVTTAPFVLRQHYNIYYHTLALKHLI